MNVLITGGRLQGLEIAYLAKKAGYVTTLVDKDANAPAAGIADMFVNGDFFDKELMTGLFKKTDIVFPAAENPAVLERLQAYAAETGTPLVYDGRCYAVSSSKTRSGKLFRELGLPLPREFPGCGFPVIIKPDGGSGSAGVRKAHNTAELSGILPLYKGDPVIQEYINGRGLSAEVIGNGGDYTLLPVTEVISGDDYDCIGINAPADISKELRERFRDVCDKIARRLSINGIFDIEALAAGDEIYLLEIDARFPSQTPISVFHAYGINMVELLAEPFVKPDIRQAEKICFYRQILVKNNRAEITGEHIISLCGRLRLVYDFFGADEAITDYAPGMREWAAIIIITADTYDAARVKLDNCITSVRRECLCRD